MDFNATQAYIRAGYSEYGAGASASKLLENPNVQREIEAQKARLADVSRATVSFIVSELLAIATSDRKTCCKHCYGIDFGYQWTEREYMRAVDKATNGAGAMPELLGGLGFIKTRAPHPECSECHGEGTPRMVELKAADKLKALEMLGRYKGMFTDKVQAEVSGPGGGAIQQAILVATPPGELSDAELRSLISANTDKLGVLPGVSRLLAAGKTIEATT